MACRERVEHMEKEEHGEMGEHAEKEEVELAQTVEETGEVEMAERRQQACLQLECADGGKLPPHDFLAPQMSSLHVHVAQGQREECC